ncbi:MAG: hypothetical protein RIC57_06045 [Balneola sp.]
MKQRRTTLQLLILYFGVLVACEPSIEDVQQQLNQSEYGKVYSFIESKIENGEAELALDQKPKAFELGVLGLLFNKTFKSEETAILITKNISIFKNPSTVDNYLWNVIVDNNFSIPTGLHEFLVNHYLDEAILYGHTRTEIDSVIKSDPSFIPYLNSRLRKTAILNFDQTAELIKLAELGNFKEPLQILTSIKELKSSIESIHDKKNILEKESGLSEFQWRLSDANVSLKNLGFDNESDVSNSFIFRGYMISFINRIGAGTNIRELYEVRSTLGDTYVLATIETTFQSKGTFSLRVVRKESFPWKIKEEFGGFTRDIPLLLEITQKQWDDSIENQNELRQLTSLKRILEASKQKAERSIQPQLQELEKEKIRNQSAITQLRKELNSWLKQNI